MTRPAVGGEPAAGESQGPAGTYLPQLDAVRALAVTCIVLTHAAFQTGRYLQGPFSAALARLDIGVAYFFVLSGYLLARPWLTPPRPGRTGPRTSGYLWRRLLRLMPAYLIAVPAALVLMPANSDASTADWLRQLTFTQIYGGGYLVHGLTQTWSLATEVAFYLALPLIGRRVAPHDRPFQLSRVMVRLVILEAVSLGWIALVAASPGLQHGAASTWLPAYLGWFGAGMALCALSIDEGERDQSGRPRHTWLSDLGAHPWGCWFTAAALFFVASTPVAGPRTLDPSTGWQAVSKHVLYGATAVLVLLPICGPAGVRGAAGWLLSSRPIRFVGQVSYGVFLYHLVVLDVVFRVGGFHPFDGKHFLTVALLTWFISVALAWVSYRWLERPALRQRRRIPMWVTQTPQTRPSPAPTTTATTELDPA